MQSVHICYCCSVAKSCPALCYSVPGFPVFRCLLEFARFMSIESVMLSNHLIFCCPFSFCLQSFPASESEIHTHIYTIYWKSYYLYKNLKHLKRSMYCLWDYSKSLHSWKNDCTPTWRQRFHQRREREIQWSEEQEYVHRFYVFTSLGKISHLLSLTGGCMGIRYITCCSPYLKLFILGF